MTKQKYDIIGDMANKKTTKVETKVPKTETKAEPKAKKYLLEIHVNDIEHKVKTDDLHQALADFVAGPDFPFAIKTRVFIKFSKGKNEGQRFFHVPEARRIFSLMEHNTSSLELLANKLMEEIA